MICKQVYKHNSTGMSKHLHINCGVNDALLSPLLNSLEGSTMQSCGKLGLRGRFRLPALKGGRGACQKSQEEIKLFGHEPTSKTNTSWLEFILHAFGVGTSHELTRTHMTHHGPDSRGVTTILPIVFSALLRRAHTQVVVCPGTPKVESQNCPSFGLPGLWDIIASRPNL